MPELPDVEMFRREAAKALNQRIMAADFGNTKLVKASRKDLNEHLIGKAFTTATRVGKNLYLAAADGSGLAMHFGMTGSLQYTGAGDQDPKYLIFSLKLENNHKLQYESRRKLGSIHFSKNIHNHIAEQDLGPDALDIKKRDFLEKIKSSNTMIKVLITDQSFIAGIGNVYADEILFQARIHPRQKASQLSHKMMEGLYEQTQNVLKTAISKQADVKKLPGKYLLPLRKKQGKCPVCEGNLQQLKISGRTTFFCPSCQKITK